jgi:hypothetical protein
MVGMILHIPTLLTAARAVGLVVTASDGRVVVRGPKGAAGLARLLLGYKTDILAAVAIEEDSAADWDAPDITSDRPNPKPSAGDQSCRRASVRAPSAATETKGPWARFWVAPDLTAAEIAALSQILDSDAWPEGSLAEAIDEVRRHNAAVLGAPEKLRSHT